MKNIILVGCAGHAKVVIDVIEKEGKYNLVGVFGGNLFDHYLYQFVVVVK